MSDELATNNPNKTWRRCARWTMVVIGCTLTLLLAWWIGDCVIGGMVNDRKVASVKIGMTPAEVSALIGPPFFTGLYGSDTHLDHLCSYRGYHYRDIIEVIFDTGWKVKEVKLSTVPPRWLQHTIG